MKQLRKEIKKPLWKIMCRIFPLCTAGWCFGSQVYYYFFTHSYAQSCVWAIWCVFSLIVYKIKQYEL